MKAIIAEVVYSCGKGTKRKSFLVKDSETLQSLIFFVTDSRFSIISVSYYENVSWKV